MEIVERMLGNDLSKNEYPYFGEEPEEKKGVQNRVTFGNNDNIDQNRKVIIFVIGGLSIAEIASVQ